ncbi:S8 family peptidase [Streptomyces sp. NPDC101175]|uniref:S8 family peptidase n=1 Tax=Streptomyces sp. NPDC101175 TaxID=3366123 RepID=UPI0038347BBC
MTTSQYRRPRTGELSWRATDLTEADESLRTAWPWSVPAQAQVSASAPALAVRDLDGATGTGVRVCVLDSGVQPDHPLVGELSAAHAVAAGPDGRPAVVEDDFGDAHGHGTACAGLVRSLAPECELTSLRVLGAESSCTGETLLAGLGWAVEQGFDVVNVSLSTTKTELRDALHDLADRAYFGGTVLVAAASNRRIESFPWRFSSVLSVGSHDLPDPRRILYNPRPPVEFFARGTNVLAPWAGGTTRVCAGNSFAAAHVTGLCAQLLSQHPGLTPFQVKSVLHLMAANVVVG